MLRTSAVARLLIGALLVWTALAATAAAQSPGPPAPSSPAADPAVPEVQGTSAPQIRTTPAPGRPDTILGMDQTSAIIVGAVLLLVIALLAVAASRGSEGRTTVIRH